MSLLILILGVALWWGAHLFKRMAPAARANLQERMGDASKGVVAGTLLLSIILMIVGWRGADITLLWVAPPWMTHVNNTLMLVAVFLLGAGHSKGKARAWMRHPMTTAVGVWAVAHLLVNGDVKSLILFGGLGLWSIVQINAINRAVPDWERPEPGPIAGDIRLVVITLVAYAVITGIHAYFVWPFPG